MPPKEKAVQRVVRIYQVKSKVIANGQFVEFPVEIKKTHAFRRIIREKFEDAESGDLPQKARLGAVIETDNPSRSSHFASLADSTEDIYEKIVYMNRALDYDNYNADRYIAIVEYYGRILEDVAAKRVKMSASALATLKEHLEAYVQAIRELRPSYVSTVESSTESSVEIPAEPSLQKAVVKQATTDTKRPTCVFPILYDTDVQKRVELNTWVLSNSSKFPEFIKNKFMNEVSKTARQSSYMWDAQSNTLKLVDIFPHQKFISDLLSRNTPYRGCLLYYGLGSGKTLSSISVAEGISLPTIVMLPASLHTNYEDDLRNKGYSAYHVENVWCFLEDDGETTDSLRKKGFPVDNRQLMERLRVSLSDGRRGYWTIEKNQKDKQPNVWKDKQHELQSDIYNEEELLSIAKTVKTVFEYKYKFIHYNGGAGIIRNLLVQSIPDFEISAEVDILKELNARKSGKDVLVSYAKLSKAERNEYKKILLRRMFVDGNIANPFDGKVVVIDEVHNFISMLCNSSINILVLYEMLMRSRDCRIVCLTGTPIINSPFELGVLFNLLKGYTRYYTFRYDGSTVDSSAIQMENPFIDRCEVDAMNGEIRVLLCVQGFVNAAFENSKAYGVQKLTGDLLSKSKHSAVYAKGEPSVSVLEGIVRKYAPTAVYKGVSYYTVFPDIFQKTIANERFDVNTKTMDEARSDFYSMYVDIAKNQINNEQLFMYRSLGVVSFYNEISVYGRDLFPKKIQGDEPDYVDISDYQLVEYDKHREVERKMEKSSSMSAAKLVHNIESKVSNVFKVFSRQRLLFTFPPNVRRPEIKDYKGNVGKERLVVSSEAEEYGEEYSEEEAEALNDNVIPQSCGDNIAVCSQRVARVENAYITATCSAIKKLTRQNLTVNDQPYNLRDLSPKYVAMLSNIDATEGLVFGYSQFRSVEGVEIFGRVLQMNGYMRYRPQVTSSEKKGSTKDLCVYDDENEDEFIVGRKVRYEVKPNEYRTFTITGFTDIKTESRKGAFLEGMAESVDIKKLYPCRFATWSGTESAEQRKAILDNYRHLDNRYGQKLLVLMTTSSGAEGINLKYVRQVHIMEPYWNRVRVEQVIGRARRNESHVDLPPNQRNVRVYQYVSRFTKAQLDGSWIKDYKSHLGTAPSATATNTDAILEGITHRINKADNQKTSDEVLFDITNRKYEIIRQFLDVIKGASVDCMFNRNANVRSNPALADIKCLEHIESTSDLAYDVASKVSRTVQEGIIEKKEAVSVYILRYRTQDGSIIHLLYESAVENLNELELDRPIPVFNFYTYYGINVLRDVNSRGTKEPIGIIMRKRSSVDDGDTILSLTLLDTFANSVDIYERIEKVIHDIKRPIPSFTDEAELVSFIDEVNAHMASEMGESSDEE